MVLMSFLVFFFFLLGEEGQAAMRRQDLYARSRQQARPDEFDSEDDGDFIVDDLGTHSQIHHGSQQQER